MRDDNDYAGMTLAELRVALSETSKQMATWTSALSEAKKEHARTFCEAYSRSPEKSVAGREKDAELGSVTDLGFILEYEGTFCSTPPSVTSSWSS